MAKLTKAQRSEISKRAWRHRRPLGIDPYTGKPVWVGGVTHGGGLYHKTSLAAKRMGIPARVISNPSPNPLKVIGGRTYHPLWTYRRKRDADDQAKMLRVKWRKGGGWAESGWAETPVSIRVLKEGERYVVYSTYEHVNPFRERATPFRGRRLPRRENPIPLIERMRWISTVMPVGQPLTLNQIARRSGLTRAEVGEALSEMVYHHLVTVGALGFTRIGRIGKGYLNPRYAYGPTGFRPPARWWAKTIAGLKVGYKRARGMTEREYSGNIARIAGGIWSRYTDTTRRKILAKYEPEALG